MAIRLRPAEVEGSGDRFETGDRFSWARKPSLLMVGAALAGVAVVQLTLKAAESFVTGPLEAEAEAEAAVGVASSGEAEFSPLGIPIANRGGLDDEGFSPLGIPNDEGLESGGTGAPEAVADAGSGFPGGDAETLGMNELPPRSGTMDGSAAEVSDEADVGVEAGDEVSFVASELGDNVAFTQPASRSLLGSETFTTSDTNASLADSLTFLGDGRTMVRFGTSYQYDTNIFSESSQRFVTRQSIVRPASPGSPAVTRTISELEDQDVQGGSVFRADLSLGLRGGVQSGPGLFYSLIYSGQYYLYETESGSDSSFDNAFRGDIALRGGYTEVSAFADFAQNGGYGYSSTLDREGRTAKSIDYSAGFGAIRRLATGSLEIGGAYQSQDYDSDLLIGRSSWSVDGAWYHDPAFLSYTTLGLGATYGYDEPSAGNSQSYFTPSVRARWNATALTSVGAWAGAQITSPEGENAADSYTTPVFGVDATWQARTSTRVTLGLSRNVQTSSLFYDQDVAQNVASIGLNQQLRDNRSLSFGYRYEHADYHATSTNAGTGPRDNYHQISAALNQQLLLLGTLNSNLSLFYNYNKNNSDSPALSFEQQLFGVRMGFEL